MGCIAVVSERPSSLTFLSLWSFDHYNFFSFLSFWNVRLLIEDSFFLSFSFQSRFGNSSNCTIAHVGRRGYENMRIQKRKRFPWFLGQAIFHLKNIKWQQKNLLKISIPSVQNLIIICIELLKCFISCQSFLVNLYCKSNSIEAGGEIFIVKQYFPLLAKHWFQGCFINTFHRWFFKM